MATSIGDQETIQSPNSVHVTRPRTALARQDQHSDPGGCQSKTMAAARSIIPKMKALRG
jgi:hypothetical protein